MNKLGAPADNNALLAAKLAPRLELVALQQGQVATDAAAGPVVEVQKVVNDVRLPAHLALEKQLPAGLPAAATTAAPADAAAPAAARLSPTARLIGALLAALPDAGPLRGAAPLWPAARQPVSAPALAGALAQAVDRSGLFYESHLAQFVAGARTLVQMAQEPQARWAPAAPARTEAATAPAAAAIAAAAPASAPEMARPAAPMAAMPPAPLPIAVDEAPAAGVLPAAPRPAQPASDASIPQAAAPQAEPGGAFVPGADAQRVRAAYRAGEGGAAAAIAAAADEPQRMRAERVPSTAPAAMPPQPGEIIHPQSATVVHQQLDLLATAVFRWSGQAWPQVPMHWSIQEEDPRPHGDDADAPQPRRWSTTVSLELPRLGAVELRLSLAAGAVQAQIVANEAATAGRLRGEGAALERRFEAAGLRLEGLRVSEREPR